jgi:hypothetical protein
MEQAKPPENAPIDVAEAKPKLDKPPAARPADQ